MAYQNLSGPGLSMPATTGLSAMRGVTVNSAGKAAYPAAKGDPIIGIITAVEESTAAANPVVTIGRVGDVNFLEAQASTMSVGDAFCIDTSGRAATVAAGNYTCGYIVEGSSGAVGRQLSALVVPVGTT